MKRGFLVRMLIDLSIVSYKMGIASALSRIKWKKLNVKTELIIGPS